MEETKCLNLADYFGSIPHLELMKSVSRRIVDPRVLHLIKSWLECAVEETDDKGRKSRANGIMASGNMCRIKRPDTWPHQPPPQKLNMPLANGEPSKQGRI